MASSSLLGAGVTGASTGAIDTTLQFRRIYGINSNVADNIAWADENTMAYIAGHSIVMFNRKDKRQKFINFNGEDISDPITAFTIGNGKRLAAVAEKGEVLSRLVHIILVHMCLL